MILIVNGKAHKYSGKATTKALLQSMRIDCERVAVMVNDKVVSRKKYSSAKLKQGDKVEILTFAGGG
ncbi:MAG: thiamine biosynthesis protein ThiS [Lentisphaerae bacterium RIFOXYA12_FULL_48_11]|nr:MAG: thiamine biosynthesis protein ThiS [Lentisphaerae bacterium RIFOXYA12_FULL_48_11]